MHTVPHAEDSRNVLRRARLDARAVVWRYARSIGHDRVYSCGHHGVMPGGGVAVKATGSVEHGDRRAGFSGASTCGSVWECPVCSHKIGAHRARELAAAADRWHERGGRLALVTLTMRHNHRQALADLWAGNAAAWAAVTSGKAWVNAQAAYGSDYLEDGRARIGWTRAVEVTQGVNGWHVHVHAVLFLHARTTAGDVAALGSQMFGRWQRALVRDGFDAPVEHLGGLDAVLVAPGDGARAAAYLAKSDYTPTERLGYEVAMGSSKRASVGHRTPFQILGDLVACHDERDAALWVEFATAAHGRRQLTWARNLRAVLLPSDVDLTDEQVAQLDHGGERLVTLDAAGFAAIRDRQHEALEAAERDDTGAALAEYLVGVLLEPHRPTEGLLAGSWAVDLPRLDAGMRRQLRAAARGRQVAADRAAKRAGLFAGIRRQRERLGC